MNNYYDLIEWAKAERLILRNKLNMVWGNGYYERDPIKQAMYFGRLRALNDLLKYMEVNNMSELKINDERNMQRALNSLNLFLEKKDQIYYFKVEHSSAGLDLVLVKYLDAPSYRGFFEKYLLSTETPLRMGGEITKIHTLLFNILG